MNQYDENRFETGAEVRDTAAPVLMSACLLGEPCRYDGRSVACARAVAFAQRHAVVAVCPEQLGGLPTPRVPSEVQPDGRVADREGADRTAAFERGARASVSLAREQGCLCAVLKSRSPSCGVREIYDGSFSGRLIAGKGKAAAALADAGLRIFDEENAPWDADPARWAYGSASKEPVDGENVPSDVGLVSGADALRSKGKPCLS